MKTIIFTDGASKGNPGPGGWGAIVVTDTKVCEYGGSEMHTTNNRMEMHAALYALTQTEGPVTIYTDSAYLLGGMRTWVSAWEKNGWKTKAGEVLNRDLWHALRDASAGRGVMWEKIKGHDGAGGNERADLIATSFAEGVTPELFCGARKKYKIDLFAKGQPTRPRSRGKKPYAYLSCVDGRVREHQSWDECKACVHGKHARYKKVFSAREAKELHNEWENK